MGNVTEGENTPSLPRSGMNVSDGQAEVNADVEIARAQTAGQSAREQTEDQP